MGHGPPSRIANKGFRKACVTCSSDKSTSSTPTSGRFWKPQASPEWSFHQPQWPQASQPISRKPSSDAKIWRANTNMCAVYQPYLAKAPSDITVSSMRFTGEFGKNRFRRQDFPDCIRASPHTWKNDMESVAARLLPNSLTTMDDAAIRTRPSGILSWPASKRAKGTPFTRRSSIIATASPSSRACPNRQTTTVTNWNSGCLSSYVLRLTRGWAASETVEAAARIALLAERSGNLGRLVLSVATRSFQAILSGELSTAAALADEALELALREGSPSLVGGLRTIQLIVHYYRGDLAGAENHFAAGLTFFDDPALRQVPGGTAISVFGWASWNAWILGQAEVARDRVAKMRAAVNPANPHDLPWADVLAAKLFALMREDETVESLAARALDLCEKDGFPNEAAKARCFLGHARAQLGCAADNIALIREAIDTLVQIGNRIGVPRYMKYLAAAQDRAGAFGDALETAEQALNFNPEEIACRPETLRIRGELRLKLGDAELADADFREAIAMARNMGAKAWELRTTMSLARLLDGKGRRDEARTMLADIYGWFTEGFDTPDLKDAKALLNELSG